MYSKRRPVYGVGVNDVDYLVAIVDKLPCGKQKQVFKCKYYARWSEMLKRCYSENYHKKKPTYKDCSVCDEWVYLSKFKAWMEQQDWEGKCLDKDILYPENKVYSPETCVFVSQRLNSFLTDSGAIRGDCPLGVTFKYKKYCSRVSNPFTGELEHLGYFSNPDDAHIAWRERKHQLACKYSELESDERIKQALVTRYL